MKLRHLPILSLLFLLPAAVKAGPIETIAELIKRGNAHEVASYFSASVDFTMMKDAGIYSKAQAELILDKFFKEHKPHEVKLLHKVSSNANYNYGVLILSTDKGKYRVAYTLREVGKAMEIIEMRIETEKT
ncbi:DUF4783 domain-containing protein [Mucilaginibacter sp.]|uniref:DUF4783 domain-containing protein n=1 Tax=Mucilaginibacter sp. TaxID=1882438 RepID=UPI000CC50BB1|nr:DUF4783 domain-containing protein [Mucilaginibacter sp.]PLW89221.1 MAG: DUF4783 domain-containing protein [Mucilaginibacter sp.]HEK20553.1 DUF4783 domain-containing protein [Bacteroidota bacterium]